MKSWKMKQYEYKVVTISSFKLYDEWETLDKFLNQFGEQGWQLASEEKETQEHDEVFHFIFMKEK